MVDGNFHGDNSVKKAILKGVSPETLKKVGRNPDIYLSTDGRIQLVSTIKKGVSFITNINIKNY